MSDAESYARPLAIGEVMPGGAVGRVLESVDPKFPVGDIAERFAEGLQGMGQWLKQGKLKYREDVAQGLENAPQAFIGMLQGRNLGKQLVQVSEWTA
jgi:NADPH-dependent curcumin reductase CurA